MSLPQDLPNLRAGQPIPRSARWWNALLAWIRSLRVTVASSGELECRRTPTGTIISWGRYNCIKVGVTSGTISARSGSTPGSGSVVLRAFQPASYTAAETVTAYWAKDATLPSGVYVILGLIDGYWHIIVADDCA